MLAKVITGIMTLPGFAHPASSMTTVVAGHNSLLSPTFGPRADEQRKALAQNTTFADSKISLVIVAASASYFFWSPLAMIVPYCSSLCNPWRKPGYQPRFDLAILHRTPFYVEGRVERYLPTSSGCCTHLRGRVQANKVQISLKTELWAFGVHFEQEIVYPYVCRRRHHHFFSCKSQK